MTHYQSRQLTAMKVAAAAGNTVIVNLEDVRAESVTAVPACQCAGTCDVIFIDVGQCCPRSWEIFPPISTSLTPYKQAQMFPVIPDKPPLNRAERRALKFKKGGR